MSKRVGTSKRRSSQRIFMTLIMIQMLMMTSIAHELGNCSPVSCSTLALVLLVSSSMQGCYANVLPLQSLYENTKKSDEKRSRNRRRLKKSTKSTKSNVVHPNPEQENEDFKQVGDDIPRLGDWYGDIRNKIHLVGMSDDGQRFADTNNVYHYDESSHSWTSLSPDSFSSYSILGISGDGQDVLVGKLNDIERVMSLELRKYDEVKDTWDNVGGGDIPYIPLELLPYFSDFYSSGGFLTKNYAKLSHDGKHIVVIDGSGIRVFELSGGLTWVQVGQTIASGVSRKIAINDDGSKIAFMVDKTSTNQPGDVDMFVYKLVPGSSGMTWKQNGGDLVNFVYYDGHDDINFDMDSAGDRVIIGQSDGDGKYYSGNAKVFEYSEALNEWEQVGNRLFGGIHVNMSADGNTVAVGRRRDILHMYYYPDSACCDTYVKIYKLWRSNGEMYWEKVATITSGPREYFGMEILSTRGLDRIAVAAKESYSVFDVTFSDQEGPCVDQEGAKFSLINVNREVGCDWLTTNNRRKFARRSRYCIQSYDNGSVIEACRKSCDMCPSN